MVSTRDDPDLPAAQVARTLGVETVPDGLVVPPQVVESDQGVVVFERDGRRLMRNMRWGFPRVARGIDEPGIIGLVADLTNPLWKGVVVDPRYRCIIPITHFRNPDGEAGRKTRTWFSVDDQPVMAWAGFCRNIPDVGPVHGGMTMEANAAIPPTNDRMPVLIEYDEVGRWLHGSIQDVIQFQFRKPIDPARMTVVRTDDRWRSGEPPPAATQPALL